MEEGDKGFWESGKALKSFWGGNFDGLNKKGCTVSGLQ
jgi:hypothetical protein